MGSALQWQSAGGCLQGAQQDETTMMCRGWLGCAALILVGAGCSRPPAPQVPVEEVSVDASGVEVAEAPQLVGEEDWPGWRGPQGNGVVAAPASVTQWSQSENVLWSADVPGRGHSSPVIVGDRVYLATADDGAQQQFVLAFDRSDGSEVWRTQVNEGGFPGSSQLHRKGTNANSTVACDGEQIYIAFLNHDKITASALDLDGEIVWRKELGAFNSKFGYAPSPVLYKSLVIFAADNQGGGYLAALDRATGEIAWRKARPAVSTYSSPAIANIAGRDQLLISGCDRVVGFDPATGEELWGVKGTTEATCGTMVWHGDSVFASGGHPGRQTLCVKADGSGEIIWSNSVRAYEPSLVVAGENVFAVTDDGIAYCWSAATGDELWKARLGGNVSASPVVCGDLIYATNDQGTTFVFRATGEGYDEVGRNQLGDDMFASAAVSRGQLFFRVGEQAGGGRREKLYCIGTPAGGAISQTD